MAQFVAFLRGINVGGHRVTGDQLVSAFSKLGLRGAATFLASGNVIFDAPGGIIDELTSAIETELRTALGYEVPTFVRTDAEVRALASTQPFDAAALAASRGKLQVALLRTVPVASSRAAVLSMADGGDLLATAGRELYWLPAGGTQESPLDLAAVERELGALTIRTKNTIERIATKFLGR